MKRSLTSKFVNALFNKKNIVRQASIICLLLVNDNILYIAK